MNADEATWLYVIGPSSGPVKIGVSQDVYRRLKELQTGYPNLLLVHAKYGFATRARAFALERRLKFLLKEKRLKGEWYKLPPKQAAEYSWKIVDGEWQRQEDFGIKWDSLLDTYVKIDAAVVPKI